MESPAAHQGRVQTKHKKGDDLCQLGGCRKLFRQFLFVLLLRLVKRTISLFEFRVIQDPAFAVYK